MRKSPLSKRLLLAAAASVYFCAPVRAQVAQTPPMGWDSYDSYGGFVNEQEVEANAQYMAANLKQYGFNTIIVDFCWSYPGTGSSGTSNGQLMQSYSTNSQGIVDSQPTPALTMNSYGQLMPDPTRFPDSIVNGQEEGFTQLAAYVHSLGLNFGIHVMRGIPVQAYYDNTPIYGDPGVTADQVADPGPGDQAPWLNQMYGMATTSTGALTSGAQAYYDSLFDTYASWGVDYVKVDDMLSTTYHAADVTAIDQAIAQSGRPMVVSLSPGPAPLSQASQLASESNMWRMLNDMWDNWSDVNSAFSAAASWEAYIGPGHWPDADMLPLGTFINPPVGTARSSSLTHNQQQTVMTLWSIIRSPLIMGGNLPSLATDSFTTSLLTNSNVIAVDQNSLNNHQVSNSGNQIVWEADAANSANKYLALFNVGSSTATVSTTFASLGLSSTTSYNVENLWTGASLGQFHGSFSQSLGSDASGMYEIFNATPTATANWSQNASGDWNSPANWSNGVVPDAVGAEANFTSAITTARTVFTDSPVTVGTIVFNNANTYELTGQGTLTMQASSGSAQIIVQAGTHNIDLPLHVASNTILNVATGAQLVIGNPVTIESGNTLTQSGGGTVTLDSVMTVNSGASLDVASSALVVSYANTFDPVAQIAAYLTTGYNGGAWNGSGIISSAVAGENTTGGLVHSVGYADGGDGIVPGLSSGQIEIMPALAGDAQLAGDVNFGDFQILAAHFGSSGGWDDGNFTYGSRIDFADFQLLAANLGAGTNGFTIGQMAALNNFAATFGDELSSSPSGIGFNLVSVPEPAAAAILATAGLSLLTRRRARSFKPGKQP